MKNNKAHTPKFFIFFFLFFAATVSVKSQLSMSDLEYEIAEKMCKKGIDIEDCSHVPLYVSFYEWLGTPYKYAGTTKKGIDCSGFTKTVIKNAYGIQLSGGSRDIFPKCEPIKKELLNEGDLVFFKIAKSSISHVGIYLQNGYFVHASVHGGVMISHLDETYYTKYFYSGGRVL